VKSSFTTIFIVGFILHVINFTVATFIEPVVRLVAFARDPAIRDAPRYSSLFLIGYGIDILFRCGFIVFSIIQTVHVS